MALAVPITDLRDTNAFLNLVEEAHEPVTVTKNGRDRLVVLTSEDYAALRDENALARLTARMTIAERERAEGTTLDARASLAAIRARHGL